MYQLTEYIKKQSYKTPTDEQTKQIRETEQYLKKNKIHQLFNQVMSRLIQTKPQNTKQGLIQILKQLKNKTTYFKKQDFQQIFDSYNFFQEQSQNLVNYNCLIQALKRITIEYSKEEFLEKYPKFKLDRFVNKTEFVNIMEAEYKALVQFNYL